MYITPVDKIDRNRESARVEVYAIMIQPARNLNEYGK
jgi:hypothetical protein